MNCVWIHISVILVSSNGNVFCMVLISVPDLVIYNNNLDSSFPSNYSQCIISSSAISWRLSKKLHQGSWVLKERLLSKTCKMDHRSLSLFPASQSVDAESMKLCISMQCAAQGGQESNYILYIYGSVLIASGWGQWDYLQTGTVLWAFPAPKDPEPPTKRCCRDPHFQRRLRFTGDKEVINAIYFLFNYRAQPRSRIYLRCSEPAVLNCPPTQIYYHVRIRQRKCETMRKRKAFDLFQLNELLSMKSKKWAL